MDFSPPSKPSADARSRDSANVGSSTAAEAATYEAAESLISAFAGAQPRQHDDQPTDNLMDDSYDANTEQSNSNNDKGRSTSVPSHSNYQEGASALAELAFASAGQSSLREVYPPLGESVKDEEEDDESSLSELDSEAETERADGDAPDEPVDSVEEAEEQEDTDDTNQAANPLSMLAAAGQVASPAPVAPIAGPAAMQMTGKRLHMDSPTPSAMGRKRKRSLIGGDQPSVGGLLSRTPSPEPDLDLDMDMDKEDEEEDEEELRQETPRKKQKEEYTKEPVESLPEEDDAAAVEEEADDERAQTRGEARDLLTELETKFAKLRDQLFKETLGDLDKDIEMVNDGTHPELVLQMELIADNRTKRLKLAEATKRFCIQNIRNEHDAMEYHTRMQFIQEKAKLRQSMITEISAKWFQVHRERRVLDMPVPEFGYQVPDRRSTQLKQRRAYDLEVMILTGLKKYIGFPAAPDVSGATNEEAMSDLDAIRATPAPAVYQTHYSGYPRTHDPYMQASINTYQPQQQNYPQMHQMQHIVPQAAAVHHQYASPMSAHYAPMLSRPMSQHQYASSLGLQQTPQSQMGAGGPQSPVRQQHQQGHPAPQNSLPQALSPPLKQQSTATGSGPNGSVSSAVDSEMSSSVQNKLPPIAALADKPSVPAMDQKDTAAPTLDTGLAKLPELKNEPGGSPPSIRLPSLDGHTRLPPITSTTSSSMNGGPKIEAAGSAGIL
ncbi:hypothetical protein SAICODRAFT_26059 [Saitoella complicata NRRL Y-17804]|nr:uncharacterized protein SAICODRAFT_26059 [Saitoella complicata NRRL Y-17804]ODQ52391.1 hypothetical protein SAICODRAFT_26059 [Saitoella complicata NRRL Y-17804]